MSGKKAGEVTALLRQGTNTRSAGNANFQRALYQFFDILPHNEQAANKIYEEILNAVCDFSHEAKLECPEECTQLEKQLEALQAKIHRVSYDTSFAKHKEEEYKREFESLDRQAARVHDAVRGKSHYCDDEYREAKNILREYQTLISRQKGDESFLYSHISQANRDLSMAENLQDRLNGIRQNVRKINKKAVEIVNLRKKAGEGKQFISDTINSIDSAVAQKFLGDQYKEMLEQVTFFLKGDDTAVIRDFPAMQKKLSVFKNTLDERYAAFLEVKQAAETHFNETYGLLTKGKFYDPVDYAKHGENASEMHIFDFLNNYARGEFVAEINEKFKKAQTALQSESFSEVHDILKLLEPLIAQANEKASLLQEEKLRLIYMMVDLKEVFRNFNYKANLEKKDNGTFKLRAENGDEYIEMEPDDVSGKLKIDHHESLSGTCGATWKEIRQACHNNGVLLQDVNKNQQSVIFTSAAQTASSQKETRARQ
ncbi:hypothetical protein [Treponema sp.]|uniref:hypothetical protein n=1 Tax=Treponema sp. TaxID=166 RepID=UPI003FA242C6